MNANELLLNKLVKIPIEWDITFQEDFFPNRLEIWVLPETLFHQVTTDSSLAHDDFHNISDGTGTRPYSSSIVFLHFCRLYPNLFVNPEHSLVELGAGTGLCGIMIAKARQRYFSKVSNSNEQSVISPSILLTDGEQLAVQIAKRNCSFLDLTKREVNVEVLTWSEDTKSIQTIAPLHSFHYVVGTDLLYYRTPIRALMITAESLLSKRPCNIETCINDDERYDGAIFLPALIRSTSIPKDLLDICDELNLILYILPIESFYTPTNPMIYNTSFLIATRTDAKLHPDLQRILENANLYTGMNEEQDFEPLPFMS
jgi:Lysine methyltransferase